MEKLERKTGDLAGSGGAELGGVRERVGAGLDETSRFSRAGEVSRSGAGETSRSGAGEVSRSGAGETEDARTLRQIKAIGSAGRKMAELSEEDRGEPGPIDEGEDIAKDTARDIHKFAEDCDPSRFERQPELLSDWRRDKRRENYQYIQMKNPHLARVYRDLMEDIDFMRPEMHAIMVGQMSPEAIKDKGAANAYFVSAERVGKSAHGGHDIYAPAVRFNFDDVEAYTRAHSDFKGHLSGLDSVFAAMALRVGAKPGDVVKNEKLVQTFIFAHEFGHAQDFMDHEFIPEMIRNGQQISKAVPAAIRRTAKQSKREAMEMPNAVASRNMDAQREIFYGRFMDKDVRTEQEAEVLQKMSYRQKGKEFYADNFATRYIMKHYNEYFCDENDREGIRAGKIPTRLDKIMRVPENLVPVLECMGGASVDFQRVTRELKPMEPMRSGFLTAALRRDQTLEYSTSGDPFDYENLFTTRGKVQNISVIMQMGKRNRVEQKVLLEMDNDRYYLLKRTKKQPPEIDERASEVADTLDLKAGKLTRIIKRELDGVSAVGEGAILSGYLRRPLRMGDAIVLDDAKDNLTFGHTSGVTRVYRKWKTYFVETSGGSKRGGSVYEILRGSGDRVRKR